MSLANIHGAEAKVKVNTTNDKMLEAMQNTASIVAGTPVILSLRVRHIPLHKRVTDVDGPLGVKVREEKHKAKPRGRGPSHSLFGVGFDQVLF